MHAPIPIQSGCLVLTAEICAIPRKTGGLLPCSPSKLEMTHPCFLQDEIPPQVQAVMPLRTLVKQITAKTSCYGLPPLVLGTIESCREFGRSGSKHHDLISSLKPTSYFSFLESSPTANLVSIRK